jgi:hypothetical protein
MRSLSKTPKMCETVLECVVLLACNENISGEAGINDKLKEVHHTSSTDSKSKCLSRHRTHFVANPISPRAAQDGIFGVHGSVSVTTSFPTNKCNSLVLLTVAAAICRL